MPHLLHDMTDAHYYRHLEIYVCQSPSNVIVATCCDATMADMVCNLLNENAERLAKVTVQRLTDSKVLTDYLIESLVPKEQWSEIAKRNDQK